MPYQRYLKSQEIVYLRKVEDEIIGRRVNLQEYDASHLLDEGLQGKAESMRDMLLFVTLGKMARRHCIGSSTLCRRLPRTSGRVGQS